MAQASVADIRIAGQFRLKEIIAYGTNEVAFYSATIVGSWEAIYAMIYFSRKNINAELTKLANKGLISDIEANILRNYIITVRLLDKGLIKYIHNMSEDMRKLVDRTSQEIEHWRKEIDNVHRTPWPRTI